MAKLLVYSIFTLMKWSLSLVKMHKFLFLPFASIRGVRIFSNLGDVCTMSWISNTIRSWMHPKMGSNSTKSWMFSELSSDSTKSWILFELELRYDQELDALWTGLRFDHELNAFWDGTHIWLGVGAQIRPKVGRSLSLSSYSTKS